MTKSIDDPHDAEVPSDTGTSIITDEQRELLRDDDENDLISQIEKVYQIWARWADFHLFIITPTVPVISPPRIIEPAIIPGTNELEFVYPIHDHGFKLSVSKGTEMFVSGLSMCKLYYTIEKMIYILIERLKEVGTDKETEVEVAFDGHELAQRKCFDSIINLSYNVVVTNFDPGTWGERYLAATKRLADLGYGYPPEAPRDVYLKPRGTTTRSKGL